MFAIKLSRVACLLPGLVTHNLAKYPNPTGLQTFAPKCQESSHALKTTFIDHYLAPYPRADVASWQIIKYKVQEGAVGTRGVSMTYLFKKKLLP